MKSLTQFLSEGGAAVPGTSPITQENVAQTVVSFYRLVLRPLGFSEKDFDILGSAGKKMAGAHSGDIDIALKIRQSKNDEADRLLKQAHQMGYKTKDTRGLSTINIGFPIVNVDGNQKGQFVQVDVFMTDNLEYSSWFNYSPHHTESPTKGVYRNYLLFTLAKELELERAGGHLHRLALTSDGLMYLKQKETKQGNKTVERMRLSQKPDVIAKKLFGKGVLGASIATFEQALALLMSPDFKRKEIVPRVLKNTVDALRREGLPIPDQLKKYG